MLESEQTPRDSEGQGRLVCCSPWGHKGLDMNEQLNNDREVNWGLMRSLWATMCLGSHKKWQP